MSQVTSNTRELNLIKRRVFIYLGRWPYFVVALLLSLTYTFFSLKYTPRTYQVGSSLKIKKSNQNLEANTLFMRGGAGFNWRQKPIHMDVIQSYPIVYKTVQRLGFDIAYYKEFGWKRREVYDKEVISVKRITPINSSVFGSELLVRFKSINRFELTFNEELKEYNTQDTINLNGFKFRILSGEKTALDTDYYIRFSDAGRLAYPYKNRLRVAQTEGMDNSMHLTMSTTLPNKTIDFLDTLVAVYIESNLEEKSQAANNTIQFIDEEIKKITDSLRVREGRLISFKESDKSLVMTTQNEKLLSDYSQLEKQKSELLVYSKYIDYVADKLNSNDFNSLTNPAVFGIENALISDMIKAIIELNLAITDYEKDGLTKSSKYQGFVEERLAIVANLKLSLKDYRTKNDILLKDIDSRLDLLDNLASAMPVSQQKLVNLQRLLKLNENLYVFLLEKKANYEIRKAATTPDVEIYEPPMLKSFAPISPKKTIAYISSIFVALFFPFMFFIIKDFFSNKIKSLDDIQRNTTIPVLGMVPHKKDTSNIAEFENLSPKSQLAEAFRSIRSNLSFMSRTKSDTKTYLISSSTSGEGKTFCSINLAKIHAIAGKRTVLVDLDLRKPKVHLYLGVDNSIGMAHYYSNSNSINEVIRKTPIENLDIITTGNIPPNPSELLMSDMTKELIENLQENYDIIILDSPPVGLVTDSSVVAKYSDVSIFVTRYNYTQIDFIDKLNEWRDTGTFENVSVILNDVVQSRTYGYGNGYGYGYGYGNGYYSDDKS